MMTFHLIRTFRTDVPVLPWVNIWVNITHILLPNTYKYIHSHFNLGVYDDFIFTFVLDFFHPETIVGGVGTNFCTQLYNRPINTNIILSLIRAVSLIYLLHDVVIAIFYPRRCV